MRQVDRPLRIAIATSGRFHVLDLARELAALGHQVRLYSMLPGGRAESFGLARRNHRSLLPFVAPFVAWQRYAPRSLPGALNWSFVRALDWSVARVLEPCDVFICMSGIFLEAALRARSNYGAQIWLERGSQHIVAQAEILKGVPGATVPSPDLIARELAGYEMADRIVIPSRHVAQSFARDPAASRKLFVNPYGTDLAMFPQTERRRDGAGQLLELIYAGTWSLQKGCDVLEAAVRQCEGVRLTHVGSIGDRAFPKDSVQFAHHGYAQQSQLIRHYASADVFVHASRQEGLSLVIVQALAAGLPVICTDRTGGSDLAYTSALAQRITVVPSGDRDRLCSAIEAARDYKRRGGQMPQLDASDRHALSWTAYARRYETELLGAVDCREMSAAPVATMNDRSKQT